MLGLALLAAFGVVYMLGFGWLSGRPWLVFGLLIALALATVPIIGVEAIGLTPYLGVYSALMLPSPWWPRTTVAVALLPLISLVAGDGFPAFFFLMVWPIIIGMVLLRLFSEGEQRADDSRAALALVAERERVARDVHDVLGHSLTALSIKAELAGRLIDVDPERARAELASIQETARQALAEVRSTVGGLRAGNLRGRAGRGAPGARRRRRRDRRARRRRRHRPAPPDAARLGAARGRHQRGPARGRDAPWWSSSARAASP